MGFSSKYQTDIDKLIAELQSMKFSYDPGKDTGYQAFAADMANQSEREKNNTLGVLSKRTGGLPSTYTVGAVKDVGDTYARKTSDGMAAYQKAALDVYNQDYTQKNSMLKNLMSMRDTEEQTYLKELAAETARLKALYGSGSTNSSSGNATVSPGASSQSSVAYSKNQQNPSEKSLSYDKALDLIRRNKASGGSRQSAESYINSLFNQGQLTKTERTELWNVIDDWQTLGKQKGKRKEDLPEWQEYMYRVTGKEFI